MSGDLSAAAVDELIGALEADDKVCLETQTPSNLRTCIDGQLSSSFLYVFYDDKGQPERVFAASVVYGQYRDVAAKALLPDVPSSDLDEAMMDEGVTEFGEVAVKGGVDYVVFARDPASAEEPFPEMPQLDGDATAAALEQAYGIQCEGTAPEHDCAASGVMATIGPEASIVDDDPPIAMTVKIEQEYSGDTKIAGVPEFFAAAGMPLSEESMQLITDCDAASTLCKPTFVNGDGLLVRIDPSNLGTKIEVGPLVPVS
ncbi:hypothetical protein GCM10027298_17870 [Epidermidibacterium keratini]